MQVDRGRRFHHTAQFDKARRHHRQIREHVGVAEKRPELLHRLRDAPSRFNDFLIRSRRVLVPRPGVLERLDLGSGLRAIFRGQDVVGSVRIERRIEVDEIDRLVGDVPPEHVRLSP